MNSTITAIIVSAGAVTLAEMGDKTQLLAMAFATKYKASKVLIGVFLATILNHALAVAAGNVVARYHSIDLWIQIIASISFIFFGLWTIKGDKLDGEENRKSKFGAVMTVAIAFFIAEVGDKTQLTTIALSIKFPNNPAGVLMGSTTGMIIADAIGIIVGVVMCKKIPERVIKLVSAIAFIIFGIIGSYKVLNEKLNLSNGLIISILLLITAITGFIALKLYEKAKQDELNNPAVAEYCKVRNVDGEIE